MKKRYDVGILGATAIVGMLPLGVNGWGMDGSVHDASGGTDSGGTGTGSVSGC